MNTLDFTKQLLAHMGVEGVEITQDDTGETTMILLTVSDQDSGLLIGRHAETIDSLQRIVRLVCQTDDSKAITLNINDFRERREERVREIARNVAKRAIDTGEEQILRLPANERRLVHMELATNEMVKTESSGEGIGRVLVVKPVTTTT